MEKCDFCQSRLARGEQVICVESCPMYALDAGPMDQLREKYGNSVEAAGFGYLDKVKPAVVFKPKRQDQSKS